MNLHPTILAQLAESSFAKSLTEGELVIDNSHYETIDGCFAQGLFAYVLRLVSARGAAPLAFGSAVHAGLEHYLREYHTNTPVANRPLDAILDESLQAAFADAEAEGLDRVADEKRNRATLELLLRSFHVDYSMRPSRYKPVVINGEPFIEKSFKLKLGTISVRKSPVTVYWSGKMDLLTWWNGDELWLCDHKTTSVMGPKFADDKQRGTQMLGYAWALRELLRPAGEGLSPKGVLIHAIAIRSKGFEFAHFPIPFADWKLDTWREEVLAQLEDFCNSFLSMLDTGHQRFGQVIPTRQHCVTKYGKCTFFDACEMAPAAQSRALNERGLFAISDWSPLNK